MKKPRKVARSSITGRFVSMAFAAENPNTTIVQTIR